MKRIRFILTMVLVAMSVMAFAQDNEQIDFQEVVRKYTMATPEVKLLMDSLNSKIQNDYRAMQVKSVCGVSFGSSRESALSLLKNKYGNPSNLSTDNMSEFKNIFFRDSNCISPQFIFIPPFIGQVIKSCT